MKKMEKVLVSLLIAFVFLESFSNKGVAAGDLTGQLSECFPNWKQEATFQIKGLLKEAGLPYDALVTKLGNDNDEKCSKSDQCKSGCCLRPFGQSASLCAKKASANEECAAKKTFGTYYKCPCESGLTCDLKMTNSLAIIDDELGFCK